MCVCIVYLPQFNSVQKIIGYILLCFISYSSFAQDTVTALPPLSHIATKDSVAKRSYSIGATGGYSLLLGNLRGIDFGNLKSGYASFEGYNLGVEGAYWLSKRFGIGAMFSNSSFYAAQDGLANMAVGYQQNMLADSAKVQALTKYNFYNLFVGPSFAFPLKNKKFVVDVRAFGGLTFVSTPDFDIVVIRSGVPYTFGQTRSMGFSYGFQGGAGIRYNFSNHVGVKLNTDFYYTDPNIKIANSNFPIDAGRQLSKYQQSVMMLHFNFSIVFKLWKKGKEELAKY
jgi:hypothetical protein